MRIAPARTGIFEKTVINRPPDKQQMTSQDWAVQHRYQRKKAFHDCQPQIARHTINRRLFIADKPSLLTLGSSSLQSRGLAGNPVKTTLERREEMNEFDKSQNSWPTHPLALDSMRSERLIQSTQPPYHMGAGHIATAAYHPFTCRTTRRNPHLPDRDVFVFLQVIAEYGHGPGIENHNCPLGQGIANAVGMALFRTRSECTEFGDSLVDHVHLWMLVTVPHGKASARKPVAAGHLKLIKLDRSLRLTTTSHRRPDSRWCRHPISLHVRASGLEHACLLTADQDAICQGN
ncbi:hypothetical protein FQR65_LT20747 [Abscondita terminalis]|nr:hypothetical protein FQR65_LT20747 [Abscondita terminalis]